MAAEVVRLGESQAPSEYQGEMVAILETVIAEIKSGRAVSFAICTATQDGACTTRWMAEGHFLATLGAASRLVTDMGARPE